MKIFITFLLFISSFSLQAKMCSLFYANRLKSQVEVPNASDKWKHCSLSCMFARRCGAEDSFMLGILKELADVVGPGNAELADLQADADGVTLWRLGMGRSDQVCKDNCKLLYPFDQPVNACQFPQTPR